MLSSAAKVGIFMLIILVILGFFILRIEDIRIDRSASTRPVKVKFDSVAGLEEKSRVRVAGVPVGKVSDISLTPDGQAIVTLEVDSSVQLREGATARVASLGMLGEKYIELDPGRPTARALPAGQEVTLAGGTGASIDDVTNQVSEIAEDIKAITESLRKTMAGPAGEQRLEEIVENVRQITSQVRLIIDNNSENVNVTADNLRAITDTLRIEIPKIAATIDRVANGIGGTVGENREDVRAIVENLKTLSSDLKVTATNLNTITGKVNTGEGTVSKLINSGEAHDKLVSALGSVESGVNELRNTLGRVGKIQLDLAIKSEYQAGLEENDETGFGGSSRSGLQVRLVPDPEKNRFYNIELSQDPRGDLKEKIIETTVLDQTTGAVVSNIVTREKKRESDFVISAQAGWQLDDLGVRIGLFDNKGGVGADWDASSKLRVTGEAFDFGGSLDPNPHLRVFGEYTIRGEKPTTPRVFVTTGVDNVLNDTAFTVGGGIRWRDEDLKYLLGSIPIN